MKLFQVLAITALLTTATTVQAQTPTTWDGGQLQLTRTELEQLLAKFEQAGRAARSDEFKLRARSEADLVRRRLEEGDFQVGDQVMLIIEGEQGMPLQLVVAPGRVLPMPNFGEVALQGVLRSELTDKLRTHIARFITNPVVRTTSLIRVAVTGEVGTPGWHVLPAESLLSDIIMKAGGPTAAAKLAGIRFERGTQRIWEGEILQRAFSDGRTLDQMSVRSGDQLVIPSSVSTRSAGSVLRVLTMVPAAILAITGLIQIL